ncbi:hypothetical protein MMC10_002943 [Thelotrema lepadinum]|nr:hypothetical protein [Thelotrema lepadinum]
MTWYSDAEVRSKITHNHILNRLPKDKQILLDEPLAGDDGLTDQTYGDWIISKSPRLFLILEDVGCPERIFDLIEKFIEDTDLPIRQGDVSKLGLGHGVHGKKFYRRQFAYQDQKLREGTHVEYDDDEIPPVKVLSTSKSDIAGTERVSLGEWELSRWSIDLDVKNLRDKGNFVRHYKTLHGLQHTHLISIFATYVHRENTFVLLSPYEMSLRTFLLEQPKEFKQKTKVRQLDQILQWIRCLLNVVVYLHEEGITHQAIRPSNIFLTADNTILLGPYSGSQPPVEDCPSTAKTAYLAPEQWPARPNKTNPAGKRLSGHRRAKSIPRLAHSRQQSLASFRSLPRPDTSTLAVPPPRNRQNSADAIPSPGLPRSRYQSETRRKFGSASSESKPLPPSPKKGNGPLHISQLYTSSTPPRGRASSTNSIDKHKGMQSDVFSLTAVIIEMLSLFACIARSSNKFSTTSLHAHLERNRGPSRKTEEPSFQSSIFQVHTWLDSLVETADTKSSRKLPRILTNINGSKGAKNELDLSHYTGLLSALVKNVRQGIERSPETRFTASEALLKMDETMDIWGIPTLCLCRQPPRQPSPPTIQYAPHTPISAVSPLSSRRETRVFGDDGVYVPSPLEPPSSKPGTSPWDRLPPVPAIPASLERANYGQDIKRLSSAPTILSPARLGDAEPVAYQRLRSLTVRSPPISDESRSPDPNLLSPLRTTKKPSPGSERSASHIIPAPSSKLNAILGIAASQPLATLDRTVSPSPSVRSLTPLLIPGKPSQVLIKTNSSDNLALTPDFQNSHISRPQSQSQIAELPCADMECSASSASSSYASDVSSAEDPTWLPPTPTSTLFHPTVYALAAAAWEEDLGDDSRSVHSLSLDSLKRKGSETSLSPTTVAKAKGFSPVFDDEKEVVLPIHLSPSVLEDIENPLDLPIHNTNEDSALENLPSSTYSASVYSSDDDDDGQSVIIALDAYEVPRPLRLSRQSRGSRGSRGSTQRVASRSHHRSRTSLGLHKSRTWASLGDSLGAKVGMGADEDVSRARFRGRWEERLNRRGTVTTVRPRAQVEVAALTPGPRTGPAAMGKQSLHTPMQEMREEIDVALDETRESLDTARRTEEEETWWGLEWNEWRRNELRLQRTHTVRRESVWMKQRRQKERQSMIRFGSA